MVKTHLNIGKRGRPQQPACGVREFTVCSREPMHVTCVGCITSLAMADAEFKAINRRR